MYRMYLENESKDFSPENNPKPHNPIENLCQNQKVNYPWTYSYAYIIYSSSLKKCIAKKYLLSKQPLLLNTKADVKSINGTRQV